MHVCTAIRGNGMVWSSDGVEGQDQDTAGGVNIDILKMTSSGLSSTIMYLTSKNDWVRSSLAKEGVEGVAIDVEGSHRWSCNYKMVLQKSKAVDEVRP